MKKTMLRIMVILFLFSMLALLFNIKQAKCLDPPATEWNKTYGGTSEDNTISAIQTGDGGYAIGANTRSFAADWSDAWLIKTDADGNVEWSKTYNRQYRDEIYCIIRTTDGGYALAGSTRPSFTGPIDAWLIKVDQFGNMQWDNTYGGVYDDYAYVVLQTRDGGYALAGQTSSGAGNVDFWLVKVDSNGNMKWEKTYGGTAGEEAYSMIATDDGGFAIAGCTRSFGAGDWDVWVVRTDSTGNIVWTKTYGGLNQEIGRKIVRTKDCGYALVGYTRSFGAGGFDAWLVRIDVNGNMQWENTFGGLNDDYGFSLVQGCDGRYAVAGCTWSFGAGESDFWLIKTDACGNMEWGKVEGGTGRDEAYVALRTSDWGYALAGYTRSFGAGDFDVWLMKLEGPLNRSIEWVQPQQLTADPEPEYFPSAMQTSSGTIWVVWGRGFPASLWYKTSSDGGVTWTSANVLFPSLGEVFGTSLLQDSTGKMWIAWAGRAGGLEIFYATSDDGGLHWSTPAQLTHYSGDNIWPSLIEVGGEVWVVFRSNSLSSSEDIWYQKTSNGGTTWSAPISLVSYSGFDTSPDALVDSSGRVWITWARHGNRNDIYYKVSTDNGLTWSDELQLSGLPSEEQQSSIVEDATGRIFVFFDVSDPPSTPDLWYKVTTDKGETWSDYQMLTSDSYNDQCPSAALIGGDIWVLWHSLDRSGNMDIWLARAVSWEHIFEDSCRGAILKISTNDKYFQFVAPDKEFPIRYDAGMRIQKYLSVSSIAIAFEDNKIALLSFALTGSLDYCLAWAKDKETETTYLLQDRLQLE